MPQRGDSWLNRRRLIKIATAGSVGGLAGCLGDNADEEPEEVLDEDETNDTADTNDTDDTADTDDTDGQYFTLPAVQNLETANFNLFAAANNPTYPPYLMFEQLGVFFPEIGDWEPQLATGWEFTDDGLELDLREDITWHDGEQVTAEDVENHYRINKLVGHPVWDHTNEIDVTGDYTLSFDLGEVNETVFLDNLITDEFIIAKSEFFGEFLERLEDATTEDEEEEIATDLLDYNISAEEAETLGNGIVQLTDVQDVEWTLDQYDDYPAELPFAGFMMRDFGEDEADFHEAAVSNEIHGFTGGTPPAIQQQLQEGPWVMFPFTRFGGISISFGGETVWGEDSDRGRNLRQGIAFLLNPSDLIELTGNPWRSDPPITQSGLDNVQIEDHLGDGLIDQFTNYGDDEIGWSLEEQAVERFEEAGFEREDDMWIDPDDGEPLTGTLHWPSAWAGSQTYEHIVQVLNDFGVESELAGQESTTYYGSILPEHEFDLAITLYGGGPHPTEAYRNNMGTLSNPDIYYTNERPTMTVPWPPGDPDGSLEEVNLEERVLELEQTTDPDREEELISELAWTWNQFMPAFCAYTLQRLHYVRTDEFDYGMDLEWGGEGIPEDLLTESMWAYLARTGDLEPSS